MAQSAALERSALLEAALQPAGAAVPVGGFEISVFHRLPDVEGIWRALTATAIESPGQSFDFTRLWVEALGVREADQFYVVAFEAGTPIALIALQRRWDKGARVLSWFLGAHVGCNAPIVDVTRVAAMSPPRRRELWLSMLRGIAGADFVYMKSVPQTVGGLELFSELGQSIEADTLYRVSFQSFADADKTQRNKSRRKHDRQQGEKLEAMGQVSFEALDDGPEAGKLLGVMFEQRDARFREMGVFNPFAVPAIRRFYDSTAVEDSGVRLKLHALKLNGETVAVRYNVAHGDRLFCLISSMSEDVGLRPGSPGKQCLLRVMQTMFDEGFHVFDMGEGLTDEKRHWCNVQIQVRHHYVPITRRGAIAVGLHRGVRQLKHRIKSDPRLLEIAKRARGMLLKLSGKGAPSATQSAPAED